MSRCTSEFRELRFVLGELTEVYVHVEARGDCPLGVQGWHFKAFPATKSVHDIVGSFETDSPLLWPQKAPEAAA
jgi:hypothetical protein